MRLIHANKGTVAVPLTGQRASVVLDQRKRTDHILVTLRATVTVAGAPAGAVRNGGRISPILTHAINENGEDTYGPARAWLLRQLAEFGAMQPLALTPLPASGALPVATYEIYEQYTINFGSRRLVGPSETAFMERDPSSFWQLDTFVSPGINAVNTLVEPAGGSTVTIDALTVTAEQIYAELAGASFPIYKPRLREQVTTVVGTNPQQILYQKSQQRLRALVIGTEVTVTADGGMVIVDDTITALRLIGDGGFNVIGPNQSAWDDLVESQRRIAGGDVAFAGGSFTRDFADDGRLANTIFPEFQAPNFRYEAAIQPSAIVGTNNVVQLIEELTRPSAANGWAVVSPELPEWAATVGG